MFAELILKDLVSHRGIEPLTTLNPYRTRSAGIITALYYHYTNGPNWCRGEDLNLYHGLTDNLARLGVSIALLDYA